MRLRTLGFKTLSCDLSAASPRANHSFPSHFLWEKRPLVGQMRNMRLVDAQSHFRCDSLPITAKGPAPSGMWATLASATLRGVEKLGEEHPRRPGDMPAPAPCWQDSKPASGDPISR